MVSLKQFPGSGLIIAKEKITKTIKGSLLAISLAILASCFSEWAGNDGTLTLVMGSTGGKAAVVPGELDNIVHTITFTGPAGTITEDFSGAGASYQLVPGRWTVSVRAVGDTPDIYNYDGTSSGDGLPGNHFLEQRMLRAMSQDYTVNIQPGKTTSVTIQMTPATEVHNYEQMLRAYSSAAFGREEIILIASDIDAYKITYSPTYNTSNPRKVIMVADKDIRISRPSDNDSAIIMASGGDTIILGRPGMKGSVTFDGEDFLMPCPLVQVGEYKSGGVSPGALVMYDKVFFTGSNNTDTGGGNGTVNIMGGTFNMYGGEISNNKANNGGGVYVGSSYPGSCEFNMFGGSIANNDASLSGGGVNVYDGTFTMNGGEISNNKANNGGGVYVGFLNRSCEFNMTGGAIGNNSAESKGGGVFVYDGTNSGASKFNMTGGAIANNTAKGMGGGINIAGGDLKLDGNARIYGNIAQNNSDARGGGVNVEAGTEFTISGNAHIYKNKAIATGNGTARGGGVCVDPYVGFTAPELIMNGGRIEENSIEGVYNPSSGGGGVFIKGNDFRMNGGFIIGNTSSNNGGGVLFNDADFTFYMNGGYIQNNTVKFESTSTYASGGGIYINAGDFIMWEGVISGNQAINTTNFGATGGGVFFGSPVSGINAKNFFKTGGIITGNSAYGNYAANTLTPLPTTSPAGYAVYVTNNMYRNSTAGENTDLNSSVTPGNWNQ